MQNRSSTLEKLPPLTNLAPGPLSLLKKAGPTLPIKVALSIVDLKKVSKVLEGLGKTVTGITKHSNGAFTVTAADPEAAANAAADNPWDDVFQHDPA